MQRLLPFLLVLASCLLSWAAPAEICEDVGFMQLGQRASKSPCPRPNILVIVVDDLGWNQVSYHAQSENKEVHTPNIDKLATRGIELNRSYATPWCAPSRSALQTGRLDALAPNVANNVWNYDAKAVVRFPNQTLGKIPFIGGLQPGTLTIGERMQQLGYATHLNGKWGIGGGAYANTPLGMGYSSFMGWYGDSMESCDGTLPGFAVGGAGPLLNALPGFWRQDNSSEVESPWCQMLRQSGALDDAELNVACKSFKEELNDVADEMIRRRSREIVEKHDFDSKPLFLVHSMQLMHLPIQYPRRFAPKTLPSGRPQNEDLRDATMGALRYVDYVVGDLVQAFKEQGQWDNTIVFLTSDNGGAIYAGTANNNYPLRGGKFNNFDGGQRVPAFFSGGWISRTLKQRHLQPFTSNTVIAINDMPETLLEMACGGPCPGGGMNNAPGPMTGRPMFRAILEKKQVIRNISYSDSMQLWVGKHGASKIWFTENGSIISDGNWTPNFPNNLEFIPDFAYLYVRPCGAPYCHFNLVSDPSEQRNLPLFKEDSIRQSVKAAWDDNVILTSSVSFIREAVPQDVALWTHYGASGPFLNRKAEPVSVRARCWCSWIDDNVAADEVTHVIFNLYLGSRCTNRAGAVNHSGALECSGPLMLTQSPIPRSAQEKMLEVIGFKTGNFNFSTIETAQWDYGPVAVLRPLTRLGWNYAVVEGLQSMNNRTGFQDWANLARWPFNLGFQSHCPTFDIFTAPTPYTQVTSWFLSAGIFNNPTSGGSLVRQNTTACFAVSPNGSVCPTLYNTPPLIDPFDVPVMTKDDCRANCVLWVN